MYFIKLHNNHNHTTANDYSCNEFEASITLSVCSCSDEAVSRAAAAGWRDQDCVRQLSTRGACVWRCALTLSCMTVCAEMLCPAACSPCAHTRVSRRTRPRAHEPHGVACATHYCLTSTGCKLSTKQIFPRLQRAFDKQNQNKKIKTSDANNTRTTYKQRQI